MAAQVWPSGCSIITIVPSSVISTQCWPLGTANCSISGYDELSALEMSFSVEAGPVTFGEAVLDPDNGDLGANGTMRYEKRERAVSSDTNTNLYQQGSRLGPLIPGWSFGASEGHQKPGSINDSFESFEVMCTSQAEYSCNILILSAIRCC